MNNPYFQWKCIVCLETTVLVDPRSQLSFCCDAHSRLYSKKKMIGAGFDGNSGADHIEMKVNELRTIFKFIVDTYVHAENQDARWEAKDYLNHLIIVLESDIGSIRARLGGYTMYKNDLESILQEGHEYEHALEKILSVVRMIIHNMTRIHNNLTELYTSVIHEKKLIDDVLNTQ